MSHEAKERVDSSSSFTKREMDQEQSNGSNMKMKVVMIPFLAHGHITPFFELAKRLSTRNIQIYLCSTPINLSSIKRRIDKNSVSSNNIKLVEFNLPSSSEFPPHYHTTTGLPHHLFPTLIKAFRNSTSDFFSNLLKTLDPDLVIYDLHQPWALTIASSYNIPAVQFLTGGAGMVSFAVHLSLGLPNRFPFREIIPHGHTEEDIPKEDGIEPFYELPMRSNKIILVNSFRKLEGKYMDYLATLLGGNKKVVPVGPVLKDTDDDGEGNTQMIMKWLGEKPASSTVFVSFGSEFYLTKQEMEEVAHGLEHSELNFIWVVRFPHTDEDKSTTNAIEEALPKGFLERIRGGSRGLVIEGWAPQAKILAHPSTGGFVSHCGWNSTMESLKFGVPVIAVPMLYDQPSNARLLEEVGAGFEVKRGKDDGIIHREDLAGAIRRVMVEEDGESIRMKAREFSETIRTKAEENIDGLVHELVQLCKDTKFT